MARFYAADTQTTNRTFIGIALTFLLFLTSHALSAQTLYGILTGTVTDSTGAAVPGATVIVRNRNNGETRTTKTNGAGEYTIRDLEIGSYTVDIPAAGSFGGYKQENVALDVNQEIRINAALKPAGVNSEVTVTTAPAMLQTETAEVNHQISSTEITELPITSSQGRNFQALYSLIPGVSAPTEQNSVASNPSRAISINVNGVEDMSNTTRIDGAVNTYGWLPYLIAYVPPADAVQTVNVTTNSFNAEQGVAGGAAINVIIKSGTNQLHGSVWEYNQLFNTNARPYTSTIANVPRVPKNIFNQYGFSIGGPVYIPKVLKGKDKLFFFQAFERTTRRQLISGNVTVPDTAMLGGNLNEVQSGLSTITDNTLLYDPQPGGIVQTNPTTSVSGYLLPQYRTTTFLSEYGCNCIPASRQSTAAAKMLALLQPLSATVGTPTASQLNSQLSNDYFGKGTFSYNRWTSDSKITYNLSDRTSIFGRYSVEPFSNLDPQQLGAAGGGTFDGGQPGLGAGRIQNVGLGASHVITPRLVVDVDGGYTRQVTGAQSALDIADGDFGLNYLGIPGTNGIGPNYVGQPVFALTGFNSLGNSNGSNPFLFRDNQFTGDVNVSYTKGKHATKYGFTYYHFDLNHFQPTSGSGIANPRGGFTFSGALTYSTASSAAVNNTTGLPASNVTNAYYSLADFLLGLPVSIQHPIQLTNPNSLRWTELAGYAQDQWTISPKLTLNYGVRYEYYPAPYRDHTGVFRLDPTLPQTANVEIGGVNGNPENAGINVSKTDFVPRVGIAYRVNDRLVVRSGFGMTTDPDSLRFLRDAFPEDLAPVYNSPQTGIPATDTSNTATYSTGAPLPLTVGIPAPVIPNLSSGFASLPISGGTNTVPANYRRGYIESWNLFIQQDLGGHFVANVGYVGTHQVRQLFGYSLDAGPLPSGSTLCMANGQYNPSSMYFTHTLGSNPCSSQANTIINQENCAGAANPVCYNTGGITMNAPLNSSNYNGLQTELTRNAGRLAQFGLIYTWSHAFAYEENGAGSGSAGTPFNYPAYFNLDRATATYDRTNNLQFYFIYHLPFGGGQQFLTHGVMSALFGGFQLNGQISHTSGAPFSVSPSNCTTNSAGNSCYADLVKPFVRLGGHAQYSYSTVNNGQPFFDPTAFANPVEPTYTATQLPGTIIAPHFGNTHRDEFRGPGFTGINASLFRAFHVYRESQFQLRAEAFNVLNHPQPANPNATIGASTPLGFINSESNSRTLQFSGRFNF